MMASTLPSLQNFFFGLQKQNRVSVAESVCSSLSLKKPQPAAGGAAGT